MSMSTKLGPSITAKHNQFIIDVFHSYGLDAERFVFGEAGEFDTISVSEAGIEALTSEPNPFLALQKIINKAISPAWLNWGIRRDGRIAVEVYE